MRASIERLSYRLKENLRKEDQPQNDLITLNRQQTSIMLQKFADYFLPSGLKYDSKKHVIISHAAFHLPNPQVCPEINQITIDPQNFLRSLAERYKPENKKSYSPLGSGKTGIETAKCLKRLSKEFETYVITKNNFPESEKNLKKLPLELQLLLAGVSADKLKALIDNDGLLFFVKRRKIPDEIVDIIYQISMYTGRRLDWLDDWFISQENGKSFPLGEHFGRLTQEEEKEVAKLLNQLEEINHSFFQLIPVDNSGEIDHQLEEKINSPFQEIEDRYRNLLINQADIGEELKTTQLAFLLSIPGFFAIDQLLETNPVLARVIPPTLADILTLWAEASPFINRNLPPKKRITEFAILIKDKYKISVISSLVLSMLGSQLVNQLEQAQKLIFAGFAYAFIPFVGALITTFQSFLQEYQRGKELREKAVNGYDGLKDSQLRIESLLKTIKHPARLYLLLAGLLGIGEGVILGAWNLLNNPLALTYVGELNESVLTTIGLFFHLQSRWLRYHRQLNQITKNHYQVRPFKGRTF